MSQKLPHPNCEPKVQKAALVALAKGFANGSRRKRYGGATRRSYDAYRLAKPERHRADVEQTQLKEWWGAARLCTFRAEVKKVLKAVSANRTHRLGRLDCPRDKAEIAR